MAECRVSFPAAVTSLLVLVMSGVPAVKFVDLVQVICDIIGNRVYSAGQARGEVFFQPPGGTSYLHINKQTMKMLKNYMIRIFIYDFYTLVTIIFFHCLLCVDSSLKHW